MNMKRNGVLVDNPAARVKRTKVNHRKQQPVKHHSAYATLFKFEDGQRVYTMVPKVNKEIQALQADGWQLVEVWQPKKPIYEKQQNSLV
ncbi:hypothetical protein MHH85_11075 [Viridibacillus sp. FSL E2-0187]|uniref:hypothetical protein n=1 Tax=Viridibacillus sp. FSL E2-0187 TaxID=2921362 RepID=UPI0030FC43BD